MAADASLRRLPYRAIGFAFVCACAMPHFLRRFPASIRSSRRAVSVGEICAKRRVRRGEARRAAGGGAKARGEAGRTSGGADGSAGFPPQIQNAMTDHHARHTHKARMSVTSSLSALCCSAAAALRAPFKSRRTNRRRSRRRRRWMHPTPTCAVSDLWIGVSRRSAHGDGCAAEEWRRRRREDEQQKPRCGEESRQVGVRSILVSSCVLCYFASRVFCLPSGDGAAEKRDAHTEKKHRRKESGSGNRPSRRRCCRR